MAHLPVPSKGIMVPIADQEWASEFTKAGSTRIPSDWLEHRLSWLKDGVPIQPDFNLSGRIKAAEDLIAWSYHGDDDGKDQLEDGKDQHEEGKIEDQEASSGILDISDDVDEEMLIPASNSLFLEISPHLRKQHQWNKRRASYQELVESAREKIMKTEDRAQKRDKLRSYARRMLKDKIKSMSRSEAISEIMPVAKRKASAKGSGKGKKLSSLLKASMKKKPSAIKNAQLKNTIKHMKENAADKVIPALANKEKQHQKMLKEKEEKKTKDQKDDESWKDDLMKSEDASPGTISTLADLPKNVRVISEASGKLNYGKEGLCNSISKDLVCTIITASGTAFASAEHVMPSSPSFGRISGH